MTFLNRSRFTVSHSHGELFAYITDLGIDILGAKFYFMRGVLHNHPPHKARKLLENTKSAMSKDSILLLDEMILPEMGTHIDAASMDITMMAAFAGMERSEKDWESIINEAGLRLIKTYVYNHAGHESVMDVRLP